MSLFSPIPKINNLRFHKWDSLFPTGKVRPVQIVRVGCVVLAKAKDGRIASLHQDLARYAYGVGDWYWMPNLMRALVALGEITQEEADQHIASCKTVGLKSEARSDLKELERILKQYGSVKKLKSAVK